MPNFLVLHQTVRAYTNRMCGNVNIPTDIRTSISSTIIRIYFVTTRTNYTWLEGDEFFLLFLSPHLMGKKELSVQTEDREIT